MEREFFAAEAEGIERLGAVVKMLEQRSFSAMLRKRQTNDLGFGELFARLILTEVVATVVDTDGPNGENKVFVIVAR